jgi:hypothetical protein
MKLFHVVSIVLGIHTDRRKKNNSVNVSNEYQMRHALDVSNFMCALSPDESKIKCV